MIGLCDCNNFYVSCERLFNPALEGRPVVVMSGNDGCVIARSNETKALGIKMGQPMFQIKELIQRHNVKILSCNLQLYGDISERVMTTLRSYVPSIEVYSIDEAFLDFTGFGLDKIEPFIRELSRIVRRNTGIPVSIGVAPTKTLAKVASKLCKSYPKLKGGCLMYRDEDIEKVLLKTPVTDIWGIGRRSGTMLASYNIRTAQEFRSAPEGWIKGTMGVTGLRTWRELRGESCIDIDSSPVERQSIMVSRSFNRDIDSLESLHNSVATFATRAAEKLRRQHSVAGQVEVFIATNRHRTDLPQHNERRVVSFTTPTDSTIEIAHAVSDLLNDIYREGYGYKKAGVVLCDISDNVGVQASMFDRVDRSKHKSLMQAVDMLNSKMGRSTVKLSSQGEGAPAINCDHCSPLYTTSWSDILKIKV
ncbi:MAG: Y-family DNA polymerase [Rikenellaceae bacterium]